MPRKQPLTLAFLIALAPPLVHATDVPTETFAELPVYNVDIRKTSVSGISSGGYMAQQFHTAHSDNIVGAGIIAGGPYYCAENSVAIALTRCMKPTAADMPDADRLAWLTRTFADQGRIASPDGMAADYVWIFSGTLDTTVYPLVSNTLADYYRHFLSDSKLKHVDHVPAAHAMVTDDFGYACDHMGESGNPDDHFINNCGFDAAGEILKHVYRYVHKPAPVADGRLIRFPQSQFIEAPTSHSMDEYGYAYVPKRCEQGARCRVHVVFHGCLQYPDRIGETFVRHAGYNDWAEQNRLIVLYPQAQNGPSQGNGNGCWDWWGYDDANYMWRGGRQIQAVKAMVDRLAGDFQPSDPPATPSGLSVSLDASAGVSLSWQSLTDPAVTGYIVYHSRVAAGPYLAVNSQATADTSLSLDNLAPGDHYFAIVAVDYQGVESVPTPAIAVTVPGL